MLLKYGNTAPEMTMPGSRQAGTGHSFACRVTPPDVGNDVDERTDAEPACRRPFHIVKAQGDVETAEGRTPRRYQLIAEPIMVPPFRKAPEERFEGSVLTFQAVGS